MTVHSWHHHSRWGEVHPFAARKRRPLRLYRVVTDRPLALRNATKGLVGAAIIGAMLWMGIALLVQAACGG